MNMLLYTVAFFCALGVNFAIVGIPEFNDYSYDGLITDMWTEQRAALGSYTVYVFELDNNRTEMVGSLDYHNHFINETYYWTETRLEWNSIWD